MNHVDALVIGAGPAGAAAALTLARNRRVAMIDRRADAGPRIGESLPAAARRLLADMRLLDSFERQGYLPCYGRRSVWGADEPVELDALVDPDGPGWQLDRAAFDAWLRDAASAAGATFVAGGVVGVDRAGDRWTVAVDAASGREHVTADVLIDAGGRSSPVAVWLGAERQAHDRLVCAWVHGRAAASGPCAGLITVEAERDGWWYTAAIPNGRRVVAFHTDADLPAARAVTSGDALLARALGTPEIRAILSGGAFGPIEHVGFVAAHSASIDPCGGDAWIAVGDAALAFDPISSQGLFNALYTGLTAAKAADGWLSGDRHAFDAYRQTIARVWHTYRRRVEELYAEERRWPDSEFWRRRLSARSSLTPSGTPQPVTASKPGPA